MAVPLVQCTKYTPQNIFDLQFCSNFLFQLHLGSCLENFPQTIFILCQSSEHIVRAAVGNTNDEGNAPLLLALNERTKRSITSFELARAVGGAAGFFLAFAILQFVPEGQDMCSHIQII